VIENGREKNKMPKLKKTKQLKALNVVAVCHGLLDNNPVTSGRRLWRCELNVCVSMTTKENRQGTNLLLLWDLNVYE